MKRILSVIIFAACCVSTYAQSVPFLLYNTDVRAGAMAAVGTEGLAAGNALPPSVGKLGQLLEHGAFENSFGKKAA